MKITFQHLAKQIILIITSLFLVSVVMARVDEPQFRLNNIKSADNKTESKIIKELDESIEILSSEIASSSILSRLYISNKDELGRISSEVDFRSPYRKAIEQCFSLLEESHSYYVFWDWNHIDNKSYFKKRDEILNILFSKSYDLNEFGIVDIREKLIEYYERQLSMMAQNIKRFDRNSPEYKLELNLIEKMSSDANALISSWNTNSKATHLSLDQKKALKEAFEAFNSARKLYGKNGKINIQEVNKFIDKERNLGEMLDKSVDEVLDDLSNVEEGTELSTILKAQKNDAINSINAISDPLTNVLKNTIASTPRIQKETFKSSKQSAKNIQKESFKSSRQSTQNIQKESFTSPEQAILVDIADEAFDALKKKKYEKALYLARQLIQEYPGYIYGYYVEGRAYEFSGKLGSAYTSYLNGLKATSHYRLHYYIGTLENKIAVRFRKNNNTKEETKFQNWALESLGTYISNVQKSGKIKKYNSKIAYSNYVIGLIYRNKGEYEEAIKYLRVSLKKEETLLTYYSLALTYYESGDFQNAMKYSKICYEKYDDTDAKSIYDKAKNKLR